MKRLYYIYNPQAGKATLNSKVGSVVEKMTRAGYEVTVRPTQAPMEATDLAREAARSGMYELVVCSGGDGTLNEVMGGMLQAGDNVPIGYIPCGSTNDFARSIGIPRGILRAADAILSGQARSLDVGTVNGRSFTYIAAFGAFTDVTYDTSQQAKNVLGPAAYIFNSLTKISGIRAFPMRITYDGHVIEDEFAFGMITNSASVGGFLTINDFAFDDGLFELTLLRLPETALEFHRTFTFLAGIHEGSHDPHIINVRASHVIIELLEDLDVPWTVDGEYMENASHLEIVNHKKAISVLIPASYKGTSFTDAEKETES